MDDIQAAAEIFATSERVVSTCSMGFYQSHQATAASCQVNNLHLLRGMLGRPGAGSLQMNGQPSAENNREAGCGTALSGFRLKGAPPDSAEPHRWGLSVSRSGDFQTSVINVADLVAEHIAHFYGRTSDVRIDRLASQSASASKPAAEGRRALESLVRVSRRGRVPRGGPPGGPTVATAKENPALA